MIKKTNNGEKRSEIPQQRDVLSKKNGPQNDQNAKISDRVSMRILSGLQGQLPVSWIRQSRQMISVKLKLMQQLVTVVESSILTATRQDSAMPQLYLRV